jgi:outer membrane protein
MDNMSTFRTALAVIALSGVAAQAQDSTVIAVIDLQKVTEQSSMGKELATQIQKLQEELEAERASKQSELQTRQTEIQGLRDELAKQRGVLSDEAVETKLSELRRMEREAQAYVEDGQRELQRMEERANEQAQQAQDDYRQKLRPHIEAAATAKGVDILLDRSAILFAKPEFDISQDVVDRANGSGAAAAPSQP